MRSVFIIMFLTISLFSDIDSQIDMIKKAPLKNRFLLMNKLKKEMIKMREDERYEALKKLKLLTKSKEDNKTKKMKKEKFFDIDEIGLDDVDIQNIEDRGIGEIENGEENR